MSYQEVTARWDNDKKEWVPVKEKTYTKKIKTQPFTMLLHPIHPSLFRISRVKDFHTLFGLCELCEFNTNKVFIHSSRRKELMELTGQSSQHLSNSLRRLRDAGLITGVKAEVVINPLVVWKGTTTTRTQATSAKTGAGLSAIKSEFDQPAE